MSPEAASKGAELISIVLSKTGLDINPEGLKPLLRGEEPPTPLFWNALIAGLRRLLTPAETEHDTAKIQQYVQEWIERGKPGQLWDASTWDIGTSEPKKQRRKT